MLKTAMMFFSEIDSKNGNCYRDNKSFIYVQDTQTDSEHKYCISLKECLNIMI